MNNQITFRSEIKFSENYDGSIKHFPLFTVPLFYCKLIPDNFEEIQSDIKKTHKRYVNSLKVNKVTCGNNENHSYSLLKNELYSNFIQKSEETLQKLFDMHGYVNVSPYVCDIWSTCMKPGEKSGRCHKHTNSLFSAVWYPFEETSPIAFDAPNNFKSEWSFDRDMSNIDSNLKKTNMCDDHFVYPEQYTFIIFDSRLYHQILQNTYFHPRYSIAVNFFIKGRLNSPTGELDLSVL